LLSICAIVIVCVCVCICCLTWRNKQYIRSDRLYTSLLLVFTF